jgi:hypothetical protein
MTFKFKKSAFFFAILPTVILTCCSVWLFTITFSITFKGPIPESISFIEIGLGVVFLLSPLLFLPILIPSYILACQYWKFSKNIELKIDLGYIEITNTDTSETIIIKKPDIQRINSIDPAMKNHRLFAGFSYLVVFSKDSRFILPSFLVTKENFFLHFGPYENLAEGFPYTPSINEKKYIYVVKARRFSLEGLGEDPIQISGRYLNLLRSLLMPGLALCLYPAYQMNIIWFLSLSILTLLIYFILLTQKKIFVNRTELIVKHLGDVRTYPISLIKNITELRFFGLPTYYLSDPIIKLVVFDNNETKKTYFFFPRDNAFSELKKLLHLD